MTPEALSCGQVLSLIGPFKTWAEAVNGCSRHGLIITGHEWKDGKLYVKTVTHPAMRQRRLAQ